MDPKEKLIISKLLKLAEKQQQIITKLAQTSDPAQDIMFIKTTVQSAASSLDGIKAKDVEQFSFSVEHHAGQYTLWMANFPENFKTAFQSKFNDIVKQKKPNLDGKIAIIWQKNPNQK